MQTGSASRARCNTPVVRSTVHTLETARLVHRALDALPVCCVSEGVC